MEPRSTCCNAPVRISGSDEGTNYHVCMRCGQACDIRGQADPNPSRLTYVVRTLESATWLSQGELDPEKVKVIWDRAHVMLCRVWEVEVAERFYPSEGRAQNLKQALLAVPEFQDAEGREQIRVFWDHVAHYFFENQNIIHEFRATFDETINPHGEHNVSLRVVPARAATAFTLFLPA